MRKNYSFHRLERLRDSREFQNIYRAKKLKISNNFILYYNITNIDVVDSHSRKIGIVVSKKVTKKAVRRNRIKRIIREVFRSNKDILPINFHFIIRALPEAEKLSNIEIQDELKRYFTTVSSKEHNN